MTNEWKFREGDYIIHNNQVLQLKILHCIPSRSGIYPVDTYRVLSIVNGNQHTNVITKDTLEQEFQLHKSKGTKLGKLFYG